MLRNSLSRLFRKSVSPAVPAAVDLDAFVAESDRLGGPGHPDCEAYWRGFALTPRTAVDQGLDPFGQAYCDQQLALYRELSGRSFDQSVNEHTHVDLARHVASPNPYDHPDPSILANHVTRLSKAFRLAGLKRDGALLDMGAGWGLSSELGAYLGLQVTAVDINPLFVELIRARAGKSGLPIEAVASSFADFEPQQAYDAVFFYECLHHALKPWTLLEKLGTHLSAEGCIVLAGEPINEIWWRHWGMRLDPLSLYCIRKYGWFETGWSMAFVRDMFIRAGFVPAVAEDSDGHVGPIVVARRSQMFSAADLLQNFVSSSASLDGDHLVFGEPLTLAVTFPEGKSTLVLTVENFRPKPIAVAITTGGKTQKLTLGRGPATLRLDQSSADGRRQIVTIAPEFWKPAKELGTPDPRVLSFHIRAGTFE